MNKMELKQYIPLRREVERIEARIAAIGDDCAEAAKLRIVLEKKRNAYLKREREIEKAMNHLPLIEQSIVALRYINGLKWEEICLRVNYEWAAVHRFHASALNKIQKDTENNAKI